MGLMQSKFRFEGPVPSLEVVRAEAKRRLGTLRDVESIHAEGQVITVSSMLGPFTHPVLCAILEAHGGRSVHLVTGAPSSQVAPAWAHAPIHALPWRQRFAVRFGWWRWLFGTIR